MKAMANAMSLRARRSVAAGDYESAANDLLATHRCGDMVVGGEGGIIHVLVGIAIQQVTLDGLRWLAAQPMVPRKVHEGILARVESDTHTGEGLALAWRVELCSCDLQAIENPEKTLAESLRTLDPTTKNDLESDETAWSKMIGKAAAQADKESVVELFCRFFRRYVSIAVSPWKMRDRFVKRDMETVFAGVSNAMKSNAKIGVWQRLALPEDKILFSFIMLAGAETASISERRCLAYREAVRAVVAIRLFVDRRGRMPETLDELVAERILPAVPVDPFDDKPLRYSKERKIVWSVGEDEIDENGTIESDPSKKPRDLVWPVQ
jgi:hypothetical protein